MVESQKQELIKRIAQEAAGGRVSWQGDYLEQLNEHGITFTEVEDEIAKINQEDQSVRRRPAAGPILTPEQLFTVPGMVATVFAVAIVYFSADTLVKTLSIPHWPTTSGQVTSFYDWSDGNVEPSQPLTRKWAFDFLGKALLGDRLIYSYSVGSKSYLSSNVRVGQTQDSDQKLYPQNSSVVVSYNPANPSEAFLESRVAIPWALLTFISFVGFLLMSLLTGAGKHSN